MNSPSQKGHDLNHQKGRISKPPVSHPPPQEAAASASPPGRTTVRAERIAADRDGAKVGSGGTGEGVKGKVIKREKQPTPPKFNIAPEKRWLEDEFPFGIAYF